MMIGFKSMKPSMIVVDDDPEMAQFISSAARSMGFDVRAAANASEFMASNP